MATLVKSEKPKIDGKGKTYATAEEASLAKNGDLLLRIKEMKIKVVINK